MLRFYWLLAVISYAASSENGNFLGCYKVLTGIKIVHIQKEYNNDVEQCALDCADKYYRYAYIREGNNCSCGNYLGIQLTNTTCNLCDKCKSFSEINDIYSTGNLAPGPPQNVRVSNITETSLRIMWEEPDSFVVISSYKIKARIMHTYSTYSQVSPEWTYSNDTFQTEIITLLPATQYNITLNTNSPDGKGVAVDKIIQTKLGDPDNIPLQPTVIKEGATTKTISLSPTVNNNGPITIYRVVVVDDDFKQDFQTEDLYSYDEATSKGIGYYITAELTPAELKKYKKFVVGDEKHYGSYPNVPLDPNKKYKFILGFVSELRGLTKYAYSPLSGTVNGVLILNVNGETSGDNPAVIIGLSIAIGLLSFMFIAGIIGFIIIKSRVTNRRQRLSDNQELTLQGPMIEVENNGYIHEEDLPVNHYKNLKHKVRTISSEHLNVDSNTLLGVGKFGRVNKGMLQEISEFVPVAVYNIADKKMGQETKRSMLQDLDLLIRTGKHENVVGLIGTCETAQTVCVVMEFYSMNLKDLLLGSRDSLPGRFSNMSEVQALDIAGQIAKGLAHLEACKIIHKQICARSVMMANGYTPKIFGYGLAQYFSHNKFPDYTRWTALEVFKGHAHNPKSDVWSFACLVWEICVLGGTPYGNVANNNEIPDKIRRGLRLPQMQYFSDDLYQIMLDCWQLDVDERPKFPALVEAFYNLKHNTLIPPLNFNLFPSFQYEQFYPDMELAVRPVF